MNWKNYKTLKNKSKVLFKKEKELISPEVKEKKDENGNIIISKREKVEKEIIVLCQQQYDPYTGEPSHETKNIYNLGDLERELGYIQSQLDDFKKQQEGLEAAIADFKSL